MLRRSLLPVLVIIVIAASPAAATSQAEPLSNLAIDDVTVAAGDWTTTDDDGGPTLSINDVTQAEGDSGSSNATFTVTLSEASLLPVTVNYASSNGTAISPDDYTATGGNLLFLPLETSKTVDVALIGDARDEIDETFTVVLSDSIGAPLDDDVGLGTITDDDPEPSISVDDVTVTEGNSGTVLASFDVTLAPVSGREVTVQYATANGTATAPADYAATSGGLTFAAGETTKQVTVPVQGDILDESNESFTVGLSNAVNATVADGQGVGTITDDDGFPSLSIDDVTVTEGNGSSVDAVFNVTLSSASLQPISVDFATADGSAIAGADYSSTSGTVNFPSGQTSRTITVPVAADLLDEIDESFTVRLSDPTNASITDDLGLGTIADNDPLPSLAVNDITVVEGNTGTTAAVFTVTLSAPSGRNASVSFATQNGSATAPADYVSATGTLNFAAGRDHETGDRARQR